MRTFTKIINILLQAAGVLGLIFGGYLLVFFGLLGNDNTQWVLGIFVVAVGFFAGYYKIFWFALNRPIDTDWISNNRTTILFITSFVLSSTK